MKESPVWRRSWRVIIQHALFRLESAITIALAIVAIGLFPRPFPFWRWWYWLVIFAIAEILIIWTSLTDVRTAQQVVGQMLRERFSPGSIKASHIRAQVEQAVQYREAMERELTSRKQGIMRDRLEDVTSRVDQWMAQICRLAQRLDKLDSDPIIQRDKDATPRAIADYSRRLAQAKDPAVREQLEKVLVSKKAHMANLEELGRTMERGQLQLEDSVSDLGTIYSQMLLLEARDVESGRMQRLSQDIDEQVQALSDIVSTLDDLYRKSAEA